MARGDAIDDAAAEDLVGDLAATPVGDGPLGSLGGLAGQGHDLADLLGADPRRPPRPWGVGQAFLQPQFVQGDRLEGPPARAPEPDGIEGHGARPGDLGVTLAVGGSEDDAGAEGDLLGGGMAPQEGLKGVVLLVGEFDGKGLGSAQDRVHRGRQGGETRYDSEGIIPESQFSRAALNKSLQRGK
jgi:hypothetical protein